MSLRLSCLSCTFLIFPLNLPLPVNKSLWVGALCLNRPVALWMFGAAGCGGDGRAHEQRGSLKVSAAGFVWDWCSCTRGWHTARSGQVPSTLWGVTLRVPSALIWAPLIFYYGVLKMCPCTVIHLAYWVSNTPIVDFSRAVLLKV